MRGRGEVAARGGGRGRARARDLAHRRSAQRTTDRPMTTSGSGVEKNATSTPIFVAQASFLVNLSAALANLRRRLEEMKQRKGMLESLTAEGRHS